MPQYHVALTTPPETVEHVSGIKSELSFTMTSKKNPHTSYCFIDVDLKSRQIIGWGTETKDKVEVHLTEGYHRVFLTKGQYNKLEQKLRTMRGANGHG
jgi:hypothetical protein